MASFRKRGKIWFYRYTDEHGRQVEKKGYTGRRETEAMAAALELEVAKVKAGLIDPKARKYRDHEARALTEHLTDYQAALLAKGGSKKHALMSRNRAERVLSLARTRRVSDLSLSKALDALAALRSDGLGPETINHHIRAVKAFSRWLWKDGRAREHYLAHLATTNPEADRRRRRRALSAAEAARLIQAAERGEVIMGMTGPDRARCYAVALGTGFRASELASLTPERFDLSADPPTATVPAAYTKNGKEAVQPLPVALAARLAPWLATLPPGRPVFPLPRRTAEMLRVDLEAAGILYETDSGVCDFHSLRGVYISNLVASGASVKTCQVLARHSTPSLTIGIYAKASLHDLVGAVDALPDLTPSTPCPEALDLRATGTDMLGIENRFALPLPYSVQGSARIDTVTHGSADASRPEHDPVVMMREPLENKGSDASCGILTATSGELGRRGGKADAEDFESGAPAPPSPPAANARHPLSHRESLLGPTAEAQGVVAPTPRSSPTLWRLADSTGQVWEHTDPQWLRRWVEIRNTSVRTVVVPSLAPRYSGGGYCANGRCSR
jgi:integrase